MKAVMIRETGGLEKLLFEEVPVPEPGPGEVLVKLKFAAMNRRDVFVRQGLYPGIKFPSIPGADGAGVIEAAGEGVADFRPGQEVIINPALNWGDNPRHSGKDFSIAGNPTDGTHAQYITISADNIFPKPDYLSWEEAAALPLGGLTGYRALFTRGQIKSGETLVIPGIGGGVATFLLQMAVAEGLKVYVTSGDDQKIEEAKNLGAVDGVNYKSDDWGKKLKKMTGGADISIDTIGGETFNVLTSIAKPGSRIVTFGATRGPQANVVIPVIFLKQLDILGTTMGTPDEFRDMLKFYEKHEIRPVVNKVFPLEDIKKAHEYMEQGNQFGKIVLEIPQD